MTVRTAAANSGSLAMCRASTLECDFPRTTPLVGAPIRSGSELTGENDVKGPGRVKTKSNLVVALSGGGIFAFFCSERDHKPQNSGCGYTA
jgi:hypothetical protein